MVANPEISRINGAKSRGAITKKGKAIASRNATKHGLLSKHPPLLVTEDLTTFQGLVEGLINHYQPESPIEYFLIQQVAMGMLKQYRLWNVEVAITNKAILIEQHRIKFPDVVTPTNDIEDVFSQYLEKRTPLKDWIGKEKTVLEGLISDLCYDLVHLDERQLRKFIEAILESIKANYYHEYQNTLVWKYQDEIKQWLSESWNEKINKCTLDLQELISRVKRLIEIAKKRIEEIDRILGEIEETERLLKQAEIDSKGLEQAELFIRYQKDINRNLYEAIDKLEEIRKTRNSQSSIGSFGKIVNFEDLQLS